jgi:hypothetical protein
MTKKKEWTYAITMKVTLKNGSKSSVVTGLYETSVYFIINNSSSMQGNVTPKQCEDAYKKTLKDKESGKVTKLELGPIITVIEDDKGMYIRKV